jgi:hypothetical protein
MSRLSKPKRKKLFELLVVRDGPYCLVGGELGNDETLVVDRWDCDPSNDDISNFRLLCPWAQRVKNSSSKRKQKVFHPTNHYVCENALVSASEPPPHTSLEFLKNMKAEPAFRHWLFEEVVRRGAVPYQEILNMGAVAARSSQATIRRYLDKELTPLRLYHSLQEGEMRMVRLRPEWEEFRRVLATQKLLDRQARNWRRDLLDGLPVVMGKRRSKKSQSSDEKNAEEQQQNP